MEKEHKKMSQGVMFNKVIVAVLVIVCGFIFCVYMNYDSISLIIGVVVGAFIPHLFLVQNAAMKKEAYRQEKEAYRLEKEEQHTASSEFHPDYAEIVTSPVASGMKALDISYKQDEASIELTQDGGRCDISKYGALLEYPRNAVRSPTQVVCKACSRESIPSPEADVMETLVSHLVQLGPSSVELQEPVIVTLLHAGPGKKYGYETIVKAFDDEEGFWKEIEEFKDTSHFPKSYKAENVIQVKISKFTYLAVISRLITDTLTVSEPNRYWWRSPQQVFLGAFKKNRNSPKLTIACASISTDCENDLIRNGYDSLAMSAGAVMRHGQKAYVRLKDGLDIQTEEGVFVKFIEGEKYLQELVYSIDRNYYQNHATSSEVPLWVYLCFYPDTNYIEKERIGSLAIDRRRLYPTEETRYHGEESMDIDPAIKESHGH